MPFRPIPPLALHLCPHRLGLRQPEGHVHGAVEVQSSREYGACLLLQAGRGIQGAEATVAVGLKRAHAEFFGEGEGLAVVGFGLRSLWRIAPHRNVAKEVQGIRLVATFLGRAWQVYVLTDTHGPFEQEERPGQVTVAEGQQTAPQQGNVRLVGCATTSAIRSPSSPRALPSVNRPSSAAGPGRDRRQDGMPKRSWRCASSTDAAVFP